MALPKPVWSNDIILNPSSLNRDTWNNDPTTLAVLRAVASCHARLGHNSHFGSNMVKVLAQQFVRFFLFVFLCFWGEGGIYWTWKKCITKLFSGPFLFWGYSLVPALISRFRMVTWRETSCCTNSTSWTFLCFVWCHACKCSLTVLTARIAWNSRFGDANMGTLYTTDFLNWTSRLSVTV